MEQVFDAEFCIDYIDSDATDFGFHTFKRLSRNFKTYFEVWLIFDQNEANL